MTAIWPNSSPSALADAGLETRIETILVGMTLAQKIGQMIQPDIRYITPDQAAQYHIGSVLSGGGAPPGGDVRASVADWVDLADQFYDAALAAGAAVPPIWGIDAVHGHNNLFGGTLFPHNIGLGAARNPELAAEIARATALEIALTGLDWNFAPTLAVARDDRWGRTYESFSEDPQLVASFAGPVVSGFQGTPGTDEFLRCPRVIATAKHYIGDGGTTAGVDQGDTVCSEEDLRDLHGLGYVEALRAGVQTVMASFSSWRGDKMHGHRYLLQEVLKNQMGFDGFVVSDWNGHGQLENSTNITGAPAVNAGIDMLMAPEDWLGLWHNMFEHLQDGSIELSRIDDAVRRILRVKLRAGIVFPNRPSSRPMVARADLVGCAEHRDLARQAVRESAVLLKNKGNLLPLRPGMRVMVMGDGCNHVAMQAGGWSLTWQGDDATNDDFPGATTTFAAIRAVVQAAGGRAEMTEDETRAGKFDVAVVVFGEQPYAEGYGDVKHLGFAMVTPEPLHLLRRMKAAGIPVVSIFLSGRPMWVNPELNVSDAFIAAWLPGSEAAGLTDLLFSDGTYDFTGRLSFSWPAHASQSPLNHGDEDYAPLFPYGFGLSLQDLDTLGDDLPEDGISDSAQSSHLEIFDRRPLAPFSMFAGDEGDWRIPVHGRRTSTKNKVVEVRSFDWRRQDDARRVAWSGGSGQVFFEADAPVNYSRLIAGGALLWLELVVHIKPDSQVVLRQDSSYPRGGEIDITQKLLSLAPNTWTTLELDLRDFRLPTGAHEELTTPFLIWTTGRLELSIGKVGVQRVDEQLAG